MERGFLAPREVVVGPSASLGAGLLRWGVRPGPVTVVVDRAVATAGLADGLMDGLAGAGFDPHVFDEIAGEPDAATVERATEFARARSTTAVVGLGGGSAMDAAKVVALLLANSGGVADWLGVVEPPNPPAPLALVPTTTGTGAEATRIAMVTVNGAKRAISCAGFVPLLAVLDAELVAGLPGPVVAATGMDAMAHAIESILSTNRSGFTVALARQAVRILVADLADAAAGDAPARARTLYAAHLAGLALNAGVVLGHSLAYVVAAPTGLSHGASCALALPYCLAYNQSVADPVAATIAEAVTGRPDARLRDAADALADLVARLQLPGRLVDVGIAADTIPQLAARLVTDYPRPNNPVPFEAGRIEALLSAMHSAGLDAAWNLTAERERAA